MTRVHLTVFRDLAAANASEATGSLGDLADLMRCTTKPSKPALPLFSLALFGKVRSRHGSLRHDANVVAVTGAVIDYDGEAVAFATAVELLKAANVAALVYTTASHRPEAPRWRIIAPASAAVAPDQHARLVNRVNGVICGIAHAESWTLSQAFYFGQVADAPPALIAVIDGEAIDLLVGLDAGAIGKPGGNRENHRGVFPDFTPEALRQLVRTYRRTVPLRCRENNFAAGTVFQGWQRLTAMPPRPGSGRGRVLYREAITAGGLLAHGWLDAEHAVLSLTAGAANCRLVRTDGEYAVQREIYRGLVEGLAHPYPPLTSVAAAVPTPTGSPYSARAVRLATLLAPDSEAPQEGAGDDEARAACPVADPPLGASGGHQNGPQAVPERGGENERTGR